MEGNPGGEEGVGNDEMGHSGDLGFLLCGGLWAEKTWKARTGARAGLFLYVHMYICTP